VVASTPDSITKNCQRVIILRVQGPLKGDPSRVPRSIFRISLLNPRRTRGAPGAGLRGRRLADTMSSEECTSAIIPDETGGVGLAREVDPYSI